MVGQKHRDNERSVRKQLYADVETLRNKQLLQQLTRKAMFSASQLDRVDLNTLCSLLKAEVAGARRGAHRVSDLTAAMLGVRYLSGALALLLLETVAARRNLLPLPRAVAAGRRRQKALECPPESIFEAIIRAAAVQIRQEAIRAHQCDSRYASGAWQAALFSVAYEAHARWAAHEASFSGPPPDVTNPTIVAQAAMVADVSRTGRVIVSNGPKHCSRCGKVRTAGSGHPRSCCDDGNKVSSPLPYAGSGVDLYMASFGDDDSFVL